MPNSARSQFVRFAKQLLAHEAALAPLVTRSDSTGFRVCEKLRRTLMVLMGNGGVQALFSRSLALAAVEIKWLRELEIRPDGSLQGLNAIEAKLTPSEIAQGEAALVARLVELLVTFIGPVMTLHLIHTIWPQGNFTESDFGK